MNTLNNNKSSPISDLFKNSFSYKICSELLDFNIVQLEKEYSWLNKKREHSLFFANLSGIFIILNILLLGFVFWSQGNINFEFIRIIRYTLFTITLLYLLENSKKDKSLWFISGFLITFIIGMLFLIIFQSNFLIGILSFLLGICLVKSGSVDKIIFWFYKYKFIYFFYHHVKFEDIYNLIDSFLKHVSD